MKRHAIVTSSLLFLGIATVAGCATHKGPNTFNRSEVGAKQTVSAGTVTGAVLGGLAGSTVGGGRGQTAATVGGAAAGAAVGNAASSSTAPGVEVTVQLDDGRTVAVVQAGTSNEFRTGDRVNVTSGAGPARVTRIN